MNVTLVTTPVSTAAPTLTEDTCADAQAASIELGRVTASQAQDSLGSLLRVRRTTVYHQRPAMSVRLMVELRMADTNATLTATLSIRSLL